MTTAADVAHFKDAFDPWALGPDNFWDVVAFLQKECPVAHGSDAKGDYYVVTKYADVLRVVQDWHTFPNGNDTQLDNEARPIVMPPIDVNPPLHRQFRKLLNPYLAPVSTAEHEVDARAIIRGLLDDLDAASPCDMTARLFQPLPPLLTLKLLMNVEDAEELTNARRWAADIAYRRRGPEVGESFRSLQTWLGALIAARRSDTTKRDDMINSLVHGTVEGGRPLSDGELTGAALIIMLGGFLTTTEASSTFLVRLAESPALQDRLRSDPTLIPTALEEHLRLMPPLPMLTRRCAADVKLGERQVRSGDRVGWMIAAANRDPEEFDDPNEFHMDRERNQHVTFGAGVHRCIGSHFARMTLRVLFTELLTRFASIRIVDGASVKWQAEGPGAWYLAASVPVTFEVARASSA